jgi:hypothetical protein
MGGCTCDRCSELFRRSGHNVALLSFTVSAGIKFWCRQTTEQRVELVMYHVFLYLWLHSCPPHPPSRSRALLLSRFLIHATSSTPMSPHVSPSHLLIHLCRELLHHVTPRHRVEVWIIIEVGFYRGLPFLKIALPSVANTRTTPGYLRLLKLPLLHFELADPRISERECVYCSLQDPCCWARGLL